MVKINSSWPNLAQSEQIVKVIMNSLLCLLPGHLVSILHVEEFTLVATIHVEYSLQSVQSIACVLDDALLLLKGLLLIVFTISWDCLCSAGESGLF